MGIRGEFNQCQQILFKAGLTYKDHDIKAFMVGFHFKYQQAFILNNFVMILLKSIATTNHKDCYLQTKPYTILTPLINDE